MPNIDPCDPNAILSWFALQVIPKHEGKVCLMLDYKERHYFLPTYQSRRKWSDRTKIIELPLIPGYVFCQMNRSHAGAVLSISGVIRVVGFGSKPCPVPDEEIDLLRKIAGSPYHPRPNPYLKLGAKVEIKDGPLSGVVGTLSNFKSQRRLVISVDMLMRSVSVEVDSFIVHAVPSAA